MCAASCDDVPSTRASISKRSIVKLAKYIVQGVSCQSVVRWTNTWISSDELKYVYGFQHVPKVIAFDLWPLNLDKSNIHGLHTHSSEECRASLESPSFYVFFFFKTWSEYSHQLINYKPWGDSEDLFGLNELIRHENITGLNALNKQKMLSLYIVNDIPGTRILVNLNDLNSLNNLSGLMIDCFI